MTLVRDLDRQDRELGRRHQTLRALAGEKAKLDLQLEALTSFTEVQARLPKLSGFAAPPPDMKRTLPEPLVDPPVPPAPPRLAVR
jgi:hypothetical protein